MKKIVLTAITLGFAATASANYQDAQNWKQLVFGNAKSDHSMTQANERSTRPLDIGDYDKGTFGVYIGGGGEN